jgi:hypothetical protein
MTSNSMRVGDRDREAAVAVLRAAYVSGRLDLDELGERASAAYCARSWGDLQRPMADLPGAARAYRRARVNQTVVSFDEIEEAEEWVVAAQPALRRPAATPMLIALVCPCVIAAAWRPVLIIPLLILLLPVLAMTSQGGWAVRRRD